jgi:hypothetical protein
MGKGANSDEARSGSRGGGRSVVADENVDVDDVVIVIVEDDPRRRVSGVRCPMPLATLLGKWWA